MPRALPLNPHAQAHPARRGGLLMVVIGVHALIGFGLWTAKVVAPQIMEMPLIVDLLTPPPAVEEKPPEAKPLPMTPTPSPPRPKTPPRPQPPVIEATQSAVPATDHAPVATPPAPPAPPAPAPEAPLVAARFDADYLRNPAPPYPPLSRRMGEEGKVLLRVTVNVHGGADQVDVKTSSGSARLDEAALSAVRRWRFVPARRGDTPVASVVLVPILFKLEQ